MVLHLVMVIGAAAEGSHENSYGGSFEEAKYEYHYTVHDNYDNNYGKQESRYGSRTDGSFYMYLPDSHLQKVYYNVDGDSGFVADVSFDGKARYNRYESFENHGRDRSKEGLYEYGYRN